MQTVKYSPESIDDLSRLIDFLSNKNAFTSRRLAIDLQEGIAKLKLFPRLGICVDHAPNPDLIRDLYIRHYTVRYLITEENIFILRIWHNKENEKNI